MSKDNGLTIGKWLIFICIVSKTRVSIEHFNYQPLLSQIWAEWEKFNQPFPNLKLFLVWWRSVEYFHLSNLKEKKKYSLWGIHRALFMLGPLIRLQKFDPIEGILNWKYLNAYNQLCLILLLSAFYRQLRKKLFVIKLAVIFIRK